MNKKVAFGVFLIALGIVLLALNGMKFKNREEVLRIGGFHATVTTEKTVPALRYVGAGCIGGGLVLLVLGWKGS